MRNDAVYQGSSQTNSTGTHPSTGHILPPQRVHLMYLWSFPHCDLQRQFSHLYVNDSRRLRPLPGRRRRCQGARRPRPSGPLMAAWDSRTRGTPRIPSRPCGAAVPGEPTQGCARTSACTVMDQVCSSAKRARSRKQRPSLSMRRPYRAGIGISGELPASTPVMLCRQLAPSGRMAVPMGSASAPDRAPGL
jgi:hypothetical protein